MQFSDEALNLAVAVICDWHSVQIQDSQGIYEVLLPKDPDWCHLVSSRKPIGRKQSPQETYCQFVPGWGTPSSSEEEWNELLDYLFYHGFKLKIEDFCSGDKYSVTVSSKGRASTTETGFDKQTLIRTVVVRHVGYEPLLKALSTVE